MATTSEGMNQSPESLKKQRELILKAVWLLKKALMDNIPCEIDEVVLFNKSLKEDNIPCKIDEGLFLGSVDSATNKVDLKNVNVTHILTVAWKLPPAYPADFVYKVIAVADRVNTNLKQHFNECFDFIDEAKRNGGNVLVHCKMGISRSVTIVVAYLMKSRGMSLSEAQQHVKNKRSQASPNRGFIRQLKDFEKSLEGFQGGIGRRLGGAVTATPCWEEEDLGPGQVVDNEEEEEEEEEKKKKKRSKFESLAGTQEKKRMNTKKKKYVLGLAAARIDFG